MRNIVKAPWTREQVLRLHARQMTATMHPYTGHDGMPLIPTARGWVEFPGGPVVQDWAHSVDVFGNVVPGRGSR